MEYGLIGEKLLHSFSKEIHSLLGDYDYSLLEMSLAEAEKLLKSKSFKGLNVTIPYKEAVVPFLDEISTEVKNAGAVNTVINKNGKLIGFNTDIPAMKAALNRSEIDIKDKNVLILGTGGTSKTAFTVCVSLGAKSISFVSRTKSENAVTYDEAHIIYADTNVIINTTPVGMFPDDDKTSVDISLFPRLEAVFDVIYNPIRTRLIIESEKAMLKTGNGLYMLVCQAVLSSEIFLGKAYEEETYENAYKKVLSDKCNIVLIGMPSCGKTTVGRIIAENTGKEFFDTDSLIEKNYGMKIKDIFEKYGEEEFRKTEKSVIEDVSRKRGTVISVGGGSVLCEENTVNLKKNSVLIFLRKDLKDLTVAEDRPLSNNIEALEKLYNERYNIYLNAADGIIDTDDFSASAKEIERRWIL